MTPAGRKQVVTRQRVGGARRPDEAASSAMGTSVNKLYDSLSAGPCRQAHTFAPLSQAALVRRAALGRHWSPSRRVASSAATWAGRLLVGAVGIYFTGAERFFSFWSPPLHYGFDAAVAACILVIFLTTDAFDRFLRTTWPYLLFLAAYLGWGVAVAREPSIVTGQAISGFLVSVLVVLSITVSLRGRQSLRSVAIAAQLAAIFTFGLALYEVAQPALVTRLAITQNASAFAFDPSRPAGLWSNPNLAGFAMLGPFLLATWGPRWLSWIGRLAAGGAIYLSGSREAFYPLVLLLVLVGVYDLLRSLRSVSRRRSTLPLVAAVALLLAVVLLSLAALGGDTIPSTSVGRLTDVTQSSSNLTTNPSRLYLLQLWLPRAIAGPWYGSGLGTFQGTGALEVLGSHNLYVTIWGEVGIPLLIAYFALLAWTVYLARARPSKKRERFLMAFFGTLWVAEGLVSHDLLLNGPGTLMIALLLCTPLALAEPATPRRGNPPQQCARASAAASRGTQSASPIQPSDRRRDLL